MDILLVNDDGVYAQGLQIMREMMPVEDKVTIVAPDRNRSGSSQSISLLRPLRVEQVSENVLAVQGSPADCVHLAMTGLLSKAPDLVISGINHGPNLGDDVLYSGTVAAAIEGMHCKHGALAISIDGRKDYHFETAAYVVLELIKQIKKGLLKHQLCNVNVPNLPRDQLQGLQVTRLGKRSKAHNLRTCQDPRGHTYYWVGLPGNPEDLNEGSDFWAIHHRYVSLTPLMTDLTAHKEIINLQAWAQQCPIK
jgi:5'-nucleotidase